MHKNGKPPWALLLAVYITVWLLASWLRSPSLDSYGDMVENYAWGQTWEWGLFQAIRRSLPWLVAAVVQRLPDGSVGRIFLLFLCECRRRCARHRRPRYAVAAAFP